MLFIARFYTATLACMEVRCSTFRLKQVIHPLFFPQKGFYANNNQKRSLFVNIKFPLVPKEDFINHESR